MKSIERDYELAAKVAKFHDDMLIGPAELAAFLGVSQISIRTRSVKVPDRVSGLNRKMQWRFGDVRAFVRGARTMPSFEAPPKPGRGRPTKVEQVAKFLGS